MSKLLVLGVASIASVYIFRKATEFETNIRVKEKFIDDNVIDTNKGLFHVNREVYNTVHEGQEYHIKAYGLQQYKKIVLQNGTPCDLSHCQEKPSLISLIASKF
jgi:hypothetical protein